jgi:hypothetical protein
MPSLLDPYVSEAALQKSIEDMAARLGWWTWHDNDSRRNEAGLPDLLLVHPEHGTLWFELKTMKGRVRKAQVGVLDLFRRAGNRVYLIRPCHMDDVEVLLNGGTVEIEE